MTPVLDALIVSVPGKTHIEVVAANILRGLGATVTEESHHSHPAHVAIGEPGSAPLHVRIDDACSRDLGGLPDRTYDVAAGYCLVLGALTAIASGEPVEVLSEGVLAHLLLPEIMASTYHSRSVPRPSSPISTPGGGVVSGEFTDDDADIFSLLMSTLPPNVTSEELSTEAQAWRLPVLPYRHLRARVSGASSFERNTPRYERTAWSRLIDRSNGSKPLEGTTVVDLTTMWAGPLGTWLLASLGASVVKIEPECRLDGYRAIDGMGIHPRDCSTDGRQSGETSALFNALNRSKTRRPIDLRVPEQRDELGPLIQHADIVIDNLSPRARRQLDIGSLIEAAPLPPIDISITAFPPGGPTSEWTGYGSGIHAFSGLGSWSGQFYAPAVSYPDPLTGMLVAVKALAAVLERRIAEHRPIRIVQSLLESVEPLQGMQHAGLISEAADPKRGWRIHNSPGLATHGFFRSMNSSAGEHDYPDPPLRPEHLLVPATPAPGRLA